MKVLRIPTALLALAMLTGADKRDLDNPTCPAEPNWGPAEAMTLTPKDIDGKRVLLAEGMIDPYVADRLRDAIEADDLIEEIWIRSSGGDAEGGNAAGKAIRSYPGMLTRIPKGWTCFSACNFMFMGGDRRAVDEGGIFMVHMFTHTGQRSVITRSVEKGTDNTIELIGEIEQLSALLASEDNDFLIRMGVSRKLLTEIMYRQAATGGEGKQQQRYCLSQEELRRYNVVPVEKAA
ncbi:hypothetical protein [Pontixanthobacter sp. CEM42]|uniref:COG3904 family protein n=1 Tax=Pontixanthobacter sp. CEM42 TaxID=2792077 RepID=UPI001FD78C50|nr:hypothetical protein [Pontixanthobacter sp. CEM42]